MRLAVDLGRQSVTEDRSKPHVGAVVVRGGIVLGSGYRGQSGEGNHAEFGVLQGLESTDLTGAIVFSTLEPCSKRNHPKIPCANRLAEAGVSDVYIGIYDPNPIIYRQGWKILRDAGVQLHDFPADLRDEIAVDNAAFISQYKIATGDRGRVTVGSRETASGVTVQTSIGAFRISTSPMGGAGVWLIDYNNNLAAVRFANTFEEVDDPGALTFGTTHYAGLPIGEIACLRSERGYLLIKNVGSRVPNIFDLDFEARGRPVE